VELAHSVDDTTLARWAQLLKFSQARLNNDNSISDLEQSHGIKLGWLVYGCYGSLAGYEELSRIVVVLSSCNKQYHRMFGENKATVFIGLLWL